MPELIPNHKVQSHPKQLCTLSQITTMHVHTGCLCGFINCTLEKHVHHSDILKWSLSHFGRESFNVQSGEMKRKGAQYILDHNTTKKKILDTSCPITKLNHFGWQLLNICKNILYLLPLFVQRYTNSGAEEQLGVKYIHQLKSHHL